MTVTTPLVSVALTWPAVLAVAQAPCSASTCASVTSFIWADRGRAGVPGVVLAQHVVDQPQDRVTVIRPAAVGGRPDQVGLVRVADPGVVAEHVAQHDVRLRGQEVRLGGRRGAAGGRRGARAVAGLTRELRAAERVTLGHVQRVVLVQLIREVAGVVVDVAGVTGRGQGRADRVLLRLPGCVRTDRGDPGVGQRGRHVRVLDARVLTGDNRVRRVVGQPVRLGEGLVQPDLLPDGGVRRWCCWRAASCRPRWSSRCRGWWRWGTPGPSSGASPGAVPVSVKE